MSTGSDALSNIDQTLNGFAADTLGVLWRAGSGTVDPWTQAEMEDAAYNQVIAAGGTADQAQAASDQVSSTIQTAPSNSESNATLAGSWFSNLTTDNGTGCSIITNPGGCVPGWVWYAGIAAGALALLYVLGPYVGLLERDR